MRWKAKTAGTLVLAGLLLASILCVATVEVRVHHTGRPHYRFLDWNLFLAWVPFALAAAASFLARRGYRIAAAVCGAWWLLFFPNAPYILSDFVHLRPSGTVPLWYDGLMLSSFAWTGLILGFASLFLMQRLWLRTAGLGWSWAGVAVTLALASVGVYLGRVHRFNSWDVVTHPATVGSVLLHNPIRHPWLIAALLVLTASLMVAYAVLYGITGVRLDLDRRSTFP